jgi:four helix bundle protein
MKNEEWMHNRDKDLRPRTKLFARQVIRLYSGLAKDTVAQVLGKQALRAGTSVGANYREADRARSKAEVIAKTGDCLKEADEATYWIELLRDEQIGHPEKVSALLNEAQELVAIFVAILKSARAP